VNASPQALASHVLRRLSFGPTPDLVRKFAADGPNAASAAIDWSLNAAPLAIQPPQAGKDDWDPTLNGWVQNLSDPNGGLHEKMTWFWHGHFAVSAVKVGNQTIMHGQQKIFRDFALGNFRELFRAVLHDPAMLLYLDASYSNVEAPNENLSRESMELFALGRGHYTEADVKAGALCLAGMEVDYDSGSVKLNPDAALGGEVILLGKRGRFSMDDVVNILSDHPACAPHITNKIYRYLVGVAPTEKRLVELANVFRSANLEIRPLVEAIVRGEDFISARMSRPRYAIEWFTAAQHAIGPLREGEDQNIWPWTLEQLDQLPGQPPNVAGWSGGVRWLSASQQLTRAAYTWAISERMRPLEPNGKSLVSAVVERCCLHEISNATKATLQEAAVATAGAADALTVSRRLITIALTSPEFALA
jgi:uncharacterized protein (DUF1800 family)